MSDLNTQNWKMFGIADLFEIKGAKRSAPELTDSGVPYVTSQTSNNGVVGYCEKAVEQGNVITVESSASGCSFYQREAFTASAHVEKLVPRFEMNTYSALFIVTVLNQDRARYSYGRKRNKESLKKGKICLPADENGRPDWQFMENCMREAVNRAYGKFIKEASESF